MSTTNSFQGLKGISPRRSFLGKVTAGALALGLAAIPAPVRTLAQSKQSAPSSNVGEFEDWLGRIKGKHRQVFDSPATNNGMPLIWSRVFLMSNKGVGVSPDDVTAVIVLRHEGIPFAMQSDLWSKYKFGEKFKTNDAVTKTAAVRNPFYQPKEGELMLPGSAIEDLLKDGVLIGVCDMAMTVYSKMMAKDMNMEADAIKKEWVDGLIPGVQVVPSGVLAVNRAQEHGCTYCYGG